MDDGKRLDSAAHAIYFVGGMSLVVGLLTVLFKIEFLQQMGIGFWTVLTGALFLFLGYVVKGGSSTALYVAIALYSLELLYALVTMVQQKAPSASGGMVVRGYLLYMMIRGIGASTGNAQESTTRSASKSGPAHTVATPPPRLTGEAEKRRLEMSALSHSKPNKHTPITSDFRRYDVGGKDSISTAASSLRFVVYRCEIAANGIKAIYSNGRSRELEWNNIASIVVRQLPPDKPWEGKLLLDILPMSAPGFPVAPVRIFAGTYVNYAALPGGQSTGTTDNIRRLVGHMLQQNPAIIADAATLGFAQQNAPAVKLQTLAQFAEYDTRYRD